jgi:DNA-directed RNA polymerase II subunit RPB1
MFHILYKLNMKRYLTSDELDYICSDITKPKHFDEVAQQHIDTVHNYIKSVAKNCKIYPSQIENLKNNLTKQYYTSLIQPGENVGIISAQSISERNTQLILNSFHSSGIAIATVVSGVPRFSELLNATKNPKNTLITLYLDHPMDNYQEIKNKYLSKLVNSKFYEFIKDIIPNSTKKKWYSAYNLLKHRILPKEFDYCISITINHEKRIENNISLYQIADIIEEIYQDLLIIPSPDVINTLDIWVNSQEVTITNECSSLINEHNKMSIYVYEVLIPLINNIDICGIPGIQHIQVVKKNNEWIIEAFGSSFLKCCGIEGINPYRTFSNNMWDIYNILGIEACREFLIQEFLNVISADAFINSRHVELLVDSMLYSGLITSISRYGLKASKKGPLSKSSFETSLDHFLKAGIHADVESTNGVSASIMVGKRTKTGTGLCDLLYDFEN